MAIPGALGRRRWPRSRRTPDADKLPDRFGFEPAREAEWRDLLAALRRAVDTELSPRQ
jgi:RNA polymerase sigma-70 factor (ECF subfamily)